MGVAYLGVPCRAAWDYNEKQSRRFRNIALVFTAMLCIACIVPAFAHADSDDLMDLFTTTAFTGSWEVFSKFNAVGKIMNFIISAFSLLGIMFTVFRFTVTLLYKSGESLFDSVYELKSRGKQDAKLFGFIGMGKEVMSGNFGTGADAILGFFMMLLPNVKAYSDYNPEKMAYNLAEDDTITTYVLKMSIPTIMTLFFFTIGFDGTLWQAYGNVVNGLSQVAKKAVEVNLAGYVNKALNAGAYYQFNFNTKDELGKFQKNIATSVYNKLLLKMESYDTTTMQNVGGQIEEWVCNHFTAGKLDVLNKAEGSRKISNDVNAAKNLSFSCCINSSKQLGTESGNCYAVATDIEYFGVSGTSTKQYVHVYINKKENADETDYFQVKKNSDGASSQTPTDSEDKKIEE